MKPLAQCEFKIKTILKREQIKSGGKTYEVLRLVHATMAPLEQSNCIRSVSFVSKS